MLRPDNLTKDLSLQKEFPEGSLQSHGKKATSKEIDVS